MGRREKQELRATCRMCNREMWILWKELREAAVGRERSSCKASPTECPELKGSPGFASIEKKRLGISHPVG